MKYGSCICINLEAFEASACMHVMCSVATCTKPFLYKIMLISDDE